MRASVVMSEKQFPSRGQPRVDPCRPAAAGDAAIVGADVIESAVDARAFEGHLLDQPPAFSARRGVIGVVEERCPEALESASRKGTERRADLDRFLAVRLRLAVALAVVIAGVDVA